jgi:hypothetical protein
MNEKAIKFNTLFKQKSFAQYFNTRKEITTLYNLLSEEEIDKLIALNTAFIRTFSPSSKGDLTEVAANGILTLINVDNNYYSKFSPEEFVAVLLHEIGHAFNPDLNEIEGEYAADRFANVKGYGYWIIKGLQKGLIGKWWGFETNSCVLRIKRLYDEGAKDPDDEDDGNLANIGTDIENNDI